MAVAVVGLAATLAGCSRDLVVLLPDEDGKVGQLAVRSDGGDVVLDSAYAASEGGGFTGPVTRTAGEAEVEATFARALAALPAAPAHFTLYFTEGTTNLERDSADEMQAMLDEVARRAAPEVQVTGHTDRLGSVADNDRLARQRAAMVRGVLIRRGLAGSMVRAVGRGEREPLVPTADEVREPRNRRVEITVR